MVALLADVTKKVEEHEPGTLIYYAFQVQGKKEIVVVERSVQQQRSLEMGSFFVEPPQPPHPFILPRHRWLAHTEYSTVLTLLHRYKDPAAVQAHVKAPYFREFSAKMPELMAKPWELRAGGFLDGSRGVSRL